MELKQWFSTHPNNGMSLSLKAPESELKVILLDKEITPIFTTIDTDVPDEAKRL